MKKLLLSLAIILVSLTSIAQTSVNFIDTKYKIPLIEIEVNGVKKIFIYDTGASITIINHDDVKSCLISSFESTMNVRGVGGDVSFIGTEEVAFKLGKYSHYTNVGVKDITGLCTSMTKQLSGDKKVIGILGMDIIIGLGINVDINNKRFIVYGEKKFNKSKKTVAEHFEKELMVTTN